MTNPDAPEPSSSGWLEDLVAEALQSLDRGGEPALAALLALHPQHERLVRQLVETVRGANLLADDAIAALPSRLGEFRLLRRLGQGGMGVVYLAEQESLGRHVALKVIRPDLAGLGSTRERFRREIEVVARCSHPAIVPIVASGEHDGLPWYAMQLVLGVTVDEACRRLRERGVAAALLRAADLRQATGGASTDAPAVASDDVYWAACVRMLRQVADALDHAHRHGVVHRDVKPSNVMLTADGRALVLDFGLARVRGDARLTRTGREPGSPAYMAPEQVRGLAADERTDVYGLAATLRELLTLVPPFPGSDPEALRRDILAGNLAAAPLRHLPPELLLVLDTAMDVDRERRYGSAAALRDDLDAVLARQPIRARRLPLRIRTWRWLQRHPKAAVAAWSLLVVVIVVPPLLAVAQARSLADLRLQKQRADAARDDALAAVREFLVQSGRSGLVNRPDGRALVAGLLQRADELLQHMPGAVTDEELRRHRLLAARWLVAAQRGDGDLIAAAQRATGALAEWPDPTAEPAVALLLAGLRAEILRLALAGQARPDLAELMRRTDAELELAVALPATRDEALDLRAETTLDRVTWWGQRNEPERQDQELAAAVAAVRATAQSGAAPRVTAIAVLENRWGDLLRARGQLEAAAEHFAAALAALEPAHDPLLAPPSHLRLRMHGAWGLGRVAAAHTQWSSAHAHYRQALQYAERDVSAFPSDEDAISGLAAVLTELAQVAPHDGWGTDDAKAALERARSLFARCQKRLAGDAAVQQSAFVNLRLLSEYHWRARDGARLAAIADALAAHRPTDAERQSMAAWRSLQAAALLAAAGDLAGAVRSDDAALAALRACEAAGWFPPIDLAAPECARLADRPEFRDLQHRHPTPRRQAPPSHR
jgi:serine/threonine protein kinase/tetratricopeptide (TPR) repeat protein